MAETAGISNELLQIVAQSRSSYGTAREARTFAQAGTQDSSPRTQRALKRLETALNSETPLRRDVPRGFYLDIKI